jgi:hypothetical protein
MTTIKSKQTSAILGVLTLVAIVAFSPHAFAQQGGIPLGSSYGSNPVPQPASMDAAMAAWSAMIAIVAVMSGVGVYTAVRKH